MKINWKNHSIPGIYCIRNHINNKVYIGKSVNIAQRVASHKCSLRAKDIKSENQHFINAWWKYGQENFDYTVLEVINLNQELISDIFKDKELFWMDYYNSTNRNFGYNLRRDSSSTMIVHEETKQKLRVAMSGSKNPNFNNKWSDKQKKDLSDLKKQMFKEGRHKIMSKEDQKKALESKTRKWEKNPHLRQEMTDKCNVHRIKYSIYQYTKDGKDLIQVWRDILELMEKHPEYKKHNIYAVLSGEKPSMYGFKWVKVLKDKDYDIVRPCEKSQD